MFFFFSSSSIVSIRNLLVFLWIAGSYKIKFLFCFVVTYVESFHTTALLLTEYIYSLAFHHNM